MPRLLLHNPIPYRWLLLTSPANGALFRSGNVISYSGTGTDAEDGTLAGKLF